MNHISLCTRVCVCVHGCVSCNRQYLRSILHIRWFLLCIYVCVCVSYRLGAVDISCQADNQVMCDGVNQVSEAGIAVQYVIQRCWLHAQVLHTHKHTHRLNKTIKTSLTNCKYGTYIASAHVEKVKQSIYTPHFTHMRKLIVLYINMDMKENEDPFTTMQWHKTLMT